MSSNAGKGEGGTKHTKGPINGQDEVDPAYREVGESGKKGNVGNLGKNELHDKGETGPAKEKGDGKGGRDGEGVMGEKQKSGGKVGSMGGGDGEGVTKGAGMKDDPDEKRESKL